MYIYAVYIYIYIYIVMSSGNSVGIGKTNTLLGLSLVSPKTSNIFLRDPVAHTWEKKEIKMVGIHLTKPWFLRNEEDEYNPKL